MSYSASLRQQANWIREALDPSTPQEQRIDLGDVDTDELEAAADHIDALVRALEAILEVDHHGFAIAPMPNLVRKQARAVLNAVGGSGNG